MSHIILRTHDGQELALLQDAIECDFVRVANDIGWFTINEALKLPIHEDTRVVIKKLM